MFAINEEQSKDILHKQVALKLSGRYSIDYSAIIGSVKIVGCTINHPSVWAEKTEGAKTIYNWVLEEAILFEKPIFNIKGRLGFWDFEQYKENE